METETKVEPIVKTVELTCSVEHAWETFTKRLSSWWPLQTHSVGAYEKKTSREVVFEPRVGGRIYEAFEEGGESEWATVQTWEPPSRFVVSWYPGQARETETEVEVRFTRLADNGCRVTLEHRGWERFGEGAIEARTGYENGWPEVWSAFERYVRSE